MLKRLELRNCFTHKKLDLDFTKGLTGILGPNGSGKSLILEMVQYALWGSAALRGMADDYKGLQVSLVFEVNGVEYDIRRTTGNARLHQGETDIASGTKGVNAAIRSLFGYSYDVFKMANAVNQGKIEELGDMLPTARKKLVDQTIGLDRMDTLGEWMGNEARELRAMITAAEKYLVEPTAPAPCPHQDTSEVYALIKRLHQNLEEARSWKEKAEVQIVHPICPTIHERLGELEALKATQGTRQALLAQQRSIQQALEGFPALGEAPQQHPLFDKYPQMLVSTNSWKESMAQRTQVMGMLEKMPEAKYTKEQIEEGEERYHQRNRWCKKQELLAELVEMVCPKCNHHWHEEDARLKDYADVPEESPTQEGMLYGKQLEEAKRVLALQVTRQGLVDALALLQERLQNYEDHTLTLQQITESQTAIRVYQERLSQEGRRLELVAQLEAIVLPQDNSTLITVLEENEQDFKDYQRGWSDAKAQETAKEAARQMYEQYPKDLDLQLDRANVAYKERLLWESEQRTFEAAQQKYQAQLAETQKDQENLKQWELCREAVKLLRQRVKAFLLPSLNKVASGLLYTMTAGVLNWIVVSEDFDITVDGQRLETLSGAGKSVANLALRIGLGRVLTGRVFNVLLLDEVDASCDDDRAAAIAACLQNLTSQISQIIQVSHKPNLVADQYVKL